MINYILGGLIIAATVYIVVKGIINLKNGKCADCDKCNSQEVVQITFKNEE